MFGWRCFTTFMDVTMHVLFGFICKPLEVAWNAAGKKRENWINKQECKIGAQCTESTISLLRASSCCGKIYFIGHQNGGISFSTYKLKQTIVKGEYPIMEQKDLYTESPNNVPSVKAV